MNKNRLHYLFYFYFTRLVCYHLIQRLDVPWSSHINLTLDDVPPKADTKRVQIRTGWWSGPCSTTTEDAIEVAIYRTTIFDRCPRNRYCNNS